MKLSAHHMRGLARYARRTSFNPGALVALAFCIAAIVSCCVSNTFVQRAAHSAGGVARDAWRGAGVSRVARPASGTPKEPWRPLVFKMPGRIGGPRVAEPGDDTQAFTLEMRVRLKALKLKEEKSSGEERAVSETKVYDLINKEAEDAKISGLYTMWYVDKERDKVKAERDNPDAAVLRKRYDEQFDILEGRKRVKPEKKEVPKQKVQPQRKGYLELTNVQESSPYPRTVTPSGQLDPDDRPLRGRSLNEDIDMLVARTGREVLATPHAPKISANVAAMMVEQPEDEEEEDEGIAEFLEQVQARSKRQDKLSARVVKSPDQRKRDFEDLKNSVSVATAGLGVLGCSVSAVMYGANVAFSFALGSVGALTYLSGLASYADNADNPTGNANGGRRLLVPVILVLTVVQWEKICYYIPALGETGLTPEIFPVVLGLITYILGEVIGGFVGPMLLKKK